MDALPERGLIFWPVGCGDSTTVVVDADTVVQIDIHHVEDSEGDDDPRIPVVDGLVELLRRRTASPTSPSSGPRTSTRTTLRASLTCSTG